MRKSKKPGKLLWKVHNCSTPVILFKATFCNPSFSSILIYTKNSNKIYQAIINSKMVSTIAAFQAYSSHKLRTSVYKLRISLEEYSQLHDEKLIDTKKLWSLLWCNVSGFVFYFKVVFLFLSARSGQKTNSIVLNLWLCSGTSIAAVSYLSTIH